MTQVLYITGSFPRLGDGIGDAAGKLYEAIPDKTKIELATTDIDSIREYIREQKYENVTLVPNWKLATINKIIKKIKKEHINKILIEYAGNGYKKDLAISFLPFRIRLHNLFTKEKVECHLRLHEFSMCRTARKIFTYPLVWFCHHMDTPSYVEYKVLSAKYGKKVNKSAIGSNIRWRTNKKDVHREPTEKIRLAFFGGIYPGKGIEKLITMWGQIERECPGIYEYQLLGGYPKGLTNVFDGYQSQIQKLIEEEGLKDKITVSGFLPESEIEKRLDKVDIAVLPYEDGLTLRRGSFLAFLARNVAVVTSDGDEEATQLFKDAEGVQMCRNSEEMITAIKKYSQNNAYIQAGMDNAKFQKNFEWEKIAVNVLNCFQA